MPQTIKQIFLDGARCLLAVVLLSLPFGALAQEVPKLGHSLERHKAVHAMVFSEMAELNARSIQINREFCGYVYRDQSGVLRLSRPRKGGSHTCLPAVPNDAVEIFASYHTHAAFAADSLNEYPSDIDLRSDFDNGWNGYVATPGGRLWFVDTQKRVARQLCGYRCLPYDRRYNEPASERRKQTVTLGYINKILSDPFID